jgi:hypothetical protein
MSNLHTSVPVRALPFTGLATLPILVIGAIVTAVGFVLTFWRTPTTARNV